MHWVFFPFLFLCLWAYGSMRSKERCIFSVPANIYGIQIDFLTSLSPSVYVILTMGLYLRGSFAGSGARGTELVFQTVT